MRLPNADRAVITEGKIRNYLLAHGHASGDSKAEFFATLGYTQENWRELEDALREQHLIKDVSETEDRRWGTYFVIVGPVHGPARMRIVRSVWIIDEGEDTPRLVTAYRQR